MHGQNRENANKAATGIEGLDYILRGGFSRNRIHLIRGGTGTGKTTLGLQFLMEGARAGERGLYLSVLQTREDLEAIARSHGWSLEGIEIEDVSYVVESERAACEQTLFHTAQVELGETVDSIQKVIERHRPDRLVFDSISEMQLLSDTPYRYRSHILGLRRFLAGHECTVLMAGEEAGKEDDSLAYLVDGVIALEQKFSDYGRAHRRLVVTKMRGAPYRSGYHDFEIKEGGLVVYPRLELDGSLTRRPERTIIQSGVRELDALLGGGLPHGSSALFVGAAGVGKSSLATLYVHSAAKRGERSALFIFDEDVETHLERSEGIGMDLRPFVEEGLVRLRKISVGEISRGKFSQLVRKAVEGDGVKVLVIDSLTGYYNSMAEERMLVIQMYRILDYAASHGVLTILIVTEHGLLGAGEARPHSTTLLADTVLLIRFFEAKGFIRRALGVFKKRHGYHESSIREMKITDKGIVVGEALEGFTGVFTGVPVFGGKESELMEMRKDAA